MGVIGKATSKGQTTIPRKVRAALGITPGSVLDWEVVDHNEVRLRVKSRNLADFAGFLGRPPNGKSVSIEEMNEGIGDAVAEEFRRSMT